MRSTRTLGLAVSATAIALALIGATSASATSTQLCNSHSALTCGEGQGANGVSMEKTGGHNVFLLTDTVNVLCLTASGAGTPLGLANPQSVHITSLSFTNCGTKSAHSNCQISVLELPLANLLKTGLDTGTLTGTNGLTLVNCDNIDIFGIDIHCIYDFTGLQFSVGAQHLTASETSVSFVEGGGLCPEESFLDALLVTTANRYVLA